MDRMRESVFAVLRGLLPGAAFLDLFSGSGIVGLEAWSRGAASVALVEKDAGKRRILAENAALAEGGARVHIMPAERFIKFSKAGPFDIVFLDPPFPYRYKEQLLRMLASSPLLAENGLVLIHYPGEEELPENIPGLARTDLRVYGRSRVGFYRRKVT